MRLLPQGTERFPGTQPAWPAGGDEGGHLVFRRHGEAPDLCRNLGGVPRGGCDVHGLPMPQF